MRDFVSREFVLVERQKRLTFLPPLSHVRLLVRVADVNAGLERIVLLEEFATGIGVGGRQEVVEQRLRGVAEGRRRESRGRHDRRIIGMRWL